jgi:hypothetical protein
VSSDDLELTGLRAFAWKNFTTDLNGVGITINPNKKDVLMWSGDGKKRGFLCQKCIRCHPGLTFSTGEKWLAKKFLEVATSSEGKPFLLAGYS